MKVDITADTIAILANIVENNPRPTRLSKQEI